MTSALGALVNMTIDQLIERSRRQRPPRPPLAASGRSRTHGAGTAKQLERLPQAEGQLFERGVPPQRMPNLSLRDHLYTDRALRRVDLRNHLDFNQVGLMGHSRGGEGMCAAYDQYLESESPWPALIATLQFPGGGTLPQTVRARESGCRASCTATDCRL